MKSKQSKEKNSKPKKTTKTEHLTVSCFSTFCFMRYIPTNKTNPWVYYYSTAYRTPDDAEIYQQFVEQDQASTVVKTRKEAAWD